MKTWAHKHSLQMSSQAIGSQPIKLVASSSENDFLTEGVYKIATRMYKQFQEERYLYWSVISAVLQVCMVRQF